MFQILKKLGFLRFGNKKIIRLDWVTLLSSPLDAVVSLVPSVRKSPMTYKKAQKQKPKPETNSHGNNLADLYYFSNAFPYR